MQPSGKNPDHRITPADLARLGDALQGQLQGLPEAPAMEGRGAWLEPLYKVLQNVMAED